MNWWKRSAGQAGQRMTVNRLRNVNNKIITRFFGPPDNVEKYEDGRIHAAEWKLRIFGIPFTIKLDADRAAREEWAEKEGLKKYKVLSIDHKIVNFAEVIGDGLLFNNIVGPLLSMMLIRGYHRPTARKTIEYVFEEMK